MIYNKFCEIEAKDWEKKACYLKCGNLLTGEHLQRVKVNVAQALDKEKCEFYLESEDGEYFKIYYWKDPK